MTHVALERSRALGYSKPLPTQPYTEFGSDSQSWGLDHSAKLAELVEKMKCVLVQQTPTSTNVYLVAETNPDPLGRFAAFYQNAALSDFRELSYDALPRPNSEAVQADWVSIACSSEVSLTLAQIEILIDGLTQTLNDGKFDELDKELSSLDPNGLSIDAVVALSRVTYPARTKLREWSSFVRRATDALKARGAERAMLGLI
jgi:hypothetical protein